MSIHFIDRQFPPCVFDSSPWALISGPLHTRIYRPSAATNSPLRHWHLASVPTSPSTATSPPPHRHRHWRPTACPPGVPGWRRWRQRLASPSDTKADAPHPSQTDVVPSSMPDADTATPPSRPPRAPHARLFPDLIALWPYFISMVGNCVNFICTMDICRWLCLRTTKITF